MRLVAAFSLGLLLLGTGLPATSASYPRAPSWSDALWATPPAANWMSVGGSIQQQHYSALTSITKANVKNLSQAWMTHLDGSCVAAKCSAEATPLVYNGVMYVVTGNDDVFALDATNGTHLWTYLSHIPQNMTSVCCGWDARGLAMGEGKIFVAQLDGNVVALDQSTGQIVWKTPNLRWQDGTGMTAAPAYYKGLVYVGSTGGEYGYRGSITAYNARTGNRVWRFYTVPEPGDIGSWSWPNDETWKVGGATVWDAPSIDPATGILYFSTGNASPTGDRLPGDDLFSSSIVALDAMTGTYKWHFQMVHHDQWDFDCPSPVVVFDPIVNGNARSAVAEACKTGWVYELDRGANGTPLIPGNIVEQPVEQSSNKHTAKTQPIVTGDPMVPHCADPVDFPSLAPDGKPFKFGCIFAAYDNTQFVAQAPGGPGGNNWAPMSWNPQTNMLYSCAIVTSAAKEAIALPFVPGEHYNPARTDNGIWPFKYGYGGTLSAYNVATNKIAWQIKTPPGEPCWGGSLSTAGGLVFWGHNTGVIEADDAATGAPLWKQQLLYGADAPPMTYSVRGKQYVAIFDGGSWFMNNRGARTPQGDAVYAFALK